MIRIAVDAMGGDRAPGAVVEGAVLAATELGVETVLVGQEDAVARELARYPSHPAIAIAAASQVISMSESPSVTLKKKDSSMMVAFNLAQQGKVQAVVSAGNSGAFMATGMFVLGKLPLVGRPAILVVIPTLGKGTVIIDAGANVDCKPRHLFQFGLMGSIYAERVLGILRPRVGVLSNGEEEEKGNDLTRAASERLRSAPLNYIGYVEGRDIASGDVDVVVCDGFTGNVVLKTKAFFSIVTLAFLSRRRSRRQDEKRCCFHNFDDFAGRFMPHSRGPTAALDPCLRETHVRVIVVRVMQVVRSFTGRLSPRRSKASSASCGGDRARQSNALPAATSLNLLRMQLLFVNRGCG